MNFVFVAELSMDNAIVIRLILIMAMRMNRTKIYNKINICQIIKGHLKKILMKINKVGKMIGIMLG